MRKRVSLALILMLLFSLIPPMPAAAADGAAIQNEVAIMELPGAKELIDLYEHYLKAANTYNKLDYAELDVRAFRHDTMEPLILQWADHEDFEVEVVGRSTNGLPIYLISYGHGATPVFLWSQMHGNEASATRALFTLFEFLADDGGQNDELRQTIKENLALYFIPMVNPDGANIYQRRNANDLDINRYAGDTRPTSVSDSDFDDWPDDFEDLPDPVEAEILWEVRNRVHPNAKDVKFGFNLHDQGEYTAVGSGGEKLATLSFLAPAIDGGAGNLTGTYEEQIEKQKVRTIDQTRADAMAVITGINEMLQEEEGIPGQVGRYGDDFGERYFGDTFTMAGTSVILIESAGYANDEEKQAQRQLNFMAILRGLAEMATGNYENYYEKRPPGETYTVPDFEKYFSIPDCGNADHAELALNGVKIEGQGETAYNMLIRRNVSLDTQGFVYANGSGTKRYPDIDWYARGHIFKVEQSSDSSPFGNEQFVAGGYTAVPGKEAAVTCLYEESDPLNQSSATQYLHGYNYLTIGDITLDDALQHLRAGEIVVRVKEVPDDIREQIHGLPLLILGPNVPADKITELDLTKEGSAGSTPLSTTSPAYFLLKNSSDKVEYAVVNGYLVDVADGKVVSTNGIPLKMKNFAFFGEVPDIHMRFWNPIAKSASDPLGGRNRTAMQLHKHFRVAEMRVGDTKTFLLDPGDINNVDGSSQVNDGATGVTVSSKHPTIASVAVKQYHELFKKETVAVPNPERAWQELTITGVAPGTTEVAVTWEGGLRHGKTDVITVTVTPKAGTGDNVLLAINQPQPLTLAAGLAKDDFAKLLPKVNLATLRGNVLADVDWELSSYNPGNVDQSLTISGAIDLSSFQNPQGLPDRVKIGVKLKATNNNLPNAEELEGLYKHYYLDNKDLDVRAFRHDVIVPLMLDLAKDDDFEIKEVGRSTNGHPMYLLKYGHGDIPVFLWSQMHGNEASATRGLFTLFEFLRSNDEPGRALRETIRENLTLYFLPIANPDGANLYQRRNAHDLDLNRYAGNTHPTDPIEFWWRFDQLPDPKEAYILWQVRNEVHPDNVPVKFGFNLHDQNEYTAAGRGTGNLAIISLLSPAIDGGPGNVTGSYEELLQNHRRTIDQTRANAMSVITGMNRMLQEVIPEQVGRYGDDFGRKYFGDSFTVEGTSVILIESGGSVNDEEKLLHRKLNFMAILRGLMEMATGNYENYYEPKERERYHVSDLAEYFHMPDCMSDPHADLALQNVNIEGQSGTYNMLIRRNVTLDGQGYVFANDPEANGYRDIDWYARGHIYRAAKSADAELFGNEKFDASGLTAVPGNVSDIVYETMAEITLAKAIAHLQAGEIAVRVKNMPEDIRDCIHGLPLVIIGPNVPAERIERLHLPTSGGEFSPAATGSAGPTGTALMEGNPANFFLVNGSGTRTHAVINGYLVSVTDGKPVWGPESRPAGKLPKLEAGPLNMKNFAYFGEVPDIHLRFMQTVENTKLLGSEQKPADGLSFANMQTQKHVRIAEMPAGESRVLYLDPGDVASGDGAASVSVHSRNTNYATVKLADSADKNERNAVPNAARNWQELTITGHRTGTTEVEVTWAGGLRDGQTDIITVTVGLSNYGVMISDKAVEIVTAIGQAGYTVNGQARTSDVAPVIVNDFTMVPLRFVSEAMGAVVTWDGANQTVGLQFEDKTHVLTIGQKAGEMAIAPTIINNRTMVPLRYLGDLMDLKVTWNPANSTVTLKK